MNEKVIKQYSINIDPCSEQRGLYIYNQESKMYVYKDGTEHGNVKIDIKANIFWDDMLEATKFVNDLAGIEDIFEIFTTVEIEKWREEKVSQSLAEVIEFLMNSQKSFTRHDVIRAVRLLFGESLEIEYNTWKDVIIDYIESNRLGVFDYTKVYDKGHWEYVYVSSDTNESDTNESDTNESDTNESDTNESSYQAQTEKTKHIIKASIVRNDGLFPGDKVIFKALEGWILFGKTEDEIDDIIIENGLCPVDDVLYQTEIKVDKSGNIQLRKKIFEMASLGYAFYSEDIWT